MRDLAKGAVLVGAVVACGVVAGCSGDGVASKRLADGYQFGDATAIVLEAAGNAPELRRRWCVEGDRVSRTLLIGAIKAYMPLYPAAGLCTDSLLLETLAAAVTAKGAGPPADPM